MPSPYPGDDSNKLATNLTPNGETVSTQAIGGYTWIMNARMLWIIAVIIAVVGVVQLLQGQIIFGIVLLVAACLVGPGGYSVFKRAR